MGIYLEEKEEKNYQAFMKELEKISKKILKPDRKNAKCNKSVTSACYNKAIEETRLFLP